MKITILLFAALCFCSLLTAGVDAQHQKKIWSLRMRQKTLRWILLVASAAALLASYAACTRHESAAPEKQGNKVPERAPQKAEPVGDSILVTGTLAFPSGAPAKGLTVIVVPLDAKGKGRIEFGFLNDQGLFGMLNPAGQTDDKGSFAISLPHNFSIKGRKFSRFSLTLRTPSGDEFDLHHGKDRFGFEFDPKAETGEIDLGQLTVPNDASVPAWLRRLSGQP